MTHSGKLLSALMIFLCASSALAAADLGVDPTFSPQFGVSDIVYDVHVLADGRLLVGGRDCSAACIPFVRRLNADGSVDPTFNLQLNPPVQGGLNTVLYIKPQSNGQFLITGDFNVGSTRSSFVRINADGSIDPTMPPRYIVVPEIEPTFDGKYVVSGSATINGENYGTAHRLNNDGTPDPSFRITFIAAHCFIKPLPDGKYIITANAVLNGPPTKPLYRLNNDGSEDTSFNTDIAVGSVGDGLTLLPDGKLLVASYLPGVGQEKVSRVTSTGATEMATALCHGDIFVPLPNGDVLTTNCRKWPDGRSHLIARLRPDGTVDPKLDDVYFDTSQIAGLIGFKDAGNSRFYAFGSFGGVSGVYGPSTRKLVRLAPNNTPPRAKFDFDGDGKSDLAVFRPSDRTWYLRQSTLGDAYIVWGIPTDRPAATHFDNDGRTNVAVFRDGVWHANSPIFGWIQMNSGIAGDQPVVGNFDDFGPNFEDYAVRGLRGGVVKWKVTQGNLTSANPSGSGQEVVIGGETISDKPIAGDFNGDSRDEVGYFRNGLWVTTDYLRVQPPGSFQWGIAGDIPVPADYDGDRQTDYAIFRPSTGDWWINSTTDGIFVVRFGQNGDIPVPADYDGDGRVDVAIYRNGSWWQYRMGTQTVHVENWGIAGDIPIPAQGQF